MSIVSILLSGITEPRTSAEISNLTGLSKSQIKDAVNDLSRTGSKVQSIGHGIHRHYYMPVKDQPRKKFEYEYLLDLVADTGEWWFMDEMAALLERNRHSIHCSIRRVKRLGIAAVETHGAGSELAFKIERVRK